MTERATPDTATSYIYADADSKFHEKIIADFLGNKWLGISDDTSRVLPTDFVSCWSSSLKVHQLANTKPI